jgi:2-iminobutanoate/2-iminopropanoate deaminase
VNVNDRGPFHAEKVRSARPKPASPYSQGVLVPPNAQWLYISGQVGMTEDGKLGVTFAEQVEIAYQNLMAVLKGGGMGPEDVVKLTIFMTPNTDLAVARSIRAKYFSAPGPASTLIFVVDLVPGYLFEVEAVAAKV